MLAVAWMRMLRLTRRGELQALRFRFTLLLGGEGMLFVVWPLTFYEPSGLPRLGSQLVAAFYALAWQQAALACLLGPAFAGAAFPAERTAGTLDALLASPLDDRDLILGNWFGFTLLVLLVLLPGWPILVFLGGLLGMEPAAIAFVALGPLVAVPVAVAVGLLASVVMRTTRGAMVLSYTSLAALALAWLSIGWLVVALSVPVCLLVAALLLRPIGRRYQAPSASGGRASHPPVDHSPICWREVWMSRRVPWWLGAVLVAGVTLAGAHVVGMRLAACIVLLLGMLVVAVRASGSIAGERERRTWDETLLMPYETHEIVLAKLEGLLRGVLPLQLAFLLGCVPSLLADGWSGAAGLLAFVVSWPALSFAAAVGLECSARHGRSWQALAFGLLGWAAQLSWQSFFAVIPATFLVFFLILPVLWVFGLWGSGAVAVHRGTTFGLAVSLVLMINMWRALEGTVRWIDEHERVPQGVRPTSVDQGGLP